MKIFESGSKKERAGKEKCPKKRKAPGGGRGHLSQVIPRERCPTMGTGQEKDWSWSLRIPPDPQWKRTATSTSMADRISMLNTSRSLILLAKMLFVSVCMIGVCLFDLLYFMSLTFLCCITKQNRNKIFQNIQSYLTQSHASLNSLSFLKSFFFNTHWFHFWGIRFCQFTHCIKTRSRNIKSKNKMILLSVEKWAIHSSLWPVSVWKGSLTTNTYLIFQKSHFYLQVCSSVWYTLIEQ